MEKVLIKLQIGNGKIIEEIIEKPDNYDFWEIGDYFSDWLNGYVKITSERVE